MDNARVAFDPAYPATGARPDPFGIDDSLESALLAGLADSSDTAPEEPGEPASGTDPDPSGPPDGSGGDPGTPPGAGASAAGAAPPAGRVQPEAENEPRDGFELPDPAPEAPVNGTLAPPLGLEEAPEGAFPEPPAPSPGEGDAAAGRGEGRPRGPFDPAPLDAAPGDPSRFASETGPESTPWSEWILDGEPADLDFASIATRDEPPERIGSREPREGIPDAPARDGASEDESAAFEPEPGFEPGARAERSAGYSPPSWSSPVVAADPDLEQTLRDGLSDDSSGDPPLEEPAASATGAGPDPENTSHRVPGSLPSDPSLEALAAEPHPGLDTAVPEESLDPPRIPAAPAAEPAPAPFAAELEVGPSPHEQAPASGREEPAILAFAADPESESALREGLSEHANPQVWPGGLRSAITTLGAGQSSPLLFVDLDGTAYPAGAIHELAAVCEVGTVVIAFGSDGTARFSREVLLAGVSDYLVKPLAAGAVREAAARAAAAARAEMAENPAGGWSVGFAGPGGSGATTLAAATAMAAAERGRYVSVLDLDRTFPALCFLLDVEPAPGLVELLSTVARASLHPEMVDGMRAERSDRIAVYGYPWSAAPPPLPPVWAICEMLAELQRRSHLVIVDGLDDPATRISLLAMVDARVLVVEPTAAGAACAARLLDRFGPMFGPDWPLVLVQNHTRALKRKTGARTLRDAGVDAAPDVAVPFEPALPAHADRGWPEGRLPKSLRKPLAALTDRVLAAPAAAPAPA